MQRARAQALIRARRLSRPSRAALVPLKWEGPVDFGVAAFSTRPLPPDDPSQYPPDPSTSPRAVPEPEPTPEPGPTTSGPSSSYSDAPRKTGGRLERYLPRLNEISSRTGTPLPSLFISFVVLHELTAILPLLALYWIFQLLGVGAGLLGWLSSISDDRGQNVAGPSPDTQAITPLESGGKSSEAEGWDGYVRAKVREWMDEGSKRAERVGRRYGILGYEKVARGSERDNSTLDDTDESGSQSRSRSRNPDRSTVVAVPGGGQLGSNGVAEKVASAIAAYVAVKALLPVRIAVSVGLAPAFSRVALNPIQRLATRFRPRRRPS